MSLLSPIAGAGKAIPDIGFGRHGLHGFHDIVNFIRELKNQKTATGTLASVEGSSDAQGGNMGGQLTPPPSATVSSDLGLSSGLSPMAPPVMQSQQPTVQHNSQIGGIMNSGFDSFLKQLYKIPFAASIR